MDPRPVRIYSHEDVPRLSYIAGIILGDILGLSWEIITDKRKLWKHPVINYSAEDIPGTFRIIPDKLLFEKGISTRGIIVSKWKNLPVFFRSEGEADFPFDIFAASFYLISRYEEYQATERDEHGRFNAASSLAFRNDFLDLPVVDLWTKELSLALLKKFRTMAFRRSEFRSMLTIDIDEPFAFLGKSILSSIAGIVSDMAGNSGNVSRRYKTIALEEKDPFDVFDYISAKIEESKSDVRFFFPVGDSSKHDLNPSWKNAEYRKLIDNVASIYKTGIHPSYNSAGRSEAIKEETRRLKSIIQKDVTRSRFHYIRLFMPESYRYLADAGITEDYSMGYHDEPGFRAGIARPFYFYDLRVEKMTKLKIFPFQVMDITLYQYKNFSPETSGKVIMKLINETRKAGGLFISIWHNTSLQDNDQWHEWRTVFEYMLNNQVNDSLS
jgi:hypothetical protein